MKKGINLLGVFLLALAVSSCSYGKKEEAPAPAETPAPAAEAPAAEAPAAEAPAAEAVPPAETPAAEAPH